MKKKWRIRIAVSLMGMVALYALAGFVVLPWWLQRWGLERVSEQITGKVTAEEISLNPFTLAATIEGLAVTDPEGAEVLGWDRLHLNLALGSIFYGGPDVQLIELAGPRLQVQIAESGEVNLQQLLAPLLLAAEDAEDRTRQTEEPARMLPVRIALLRVSAGRIRFEDAALERPVEIEATPIDFELKNFESHPDQANAYRLNIALNKEARLSWEGQFSLFPLRSAAKVELAGLQPKAFLPYFEDVLPFEIQSAEVALSFEYAFDPLAATPVMNVADVQFALADLGLAMGGTPFFHMKELRLSDLSVDVPGALIRAARVAATVDFLRVVRKQDGEIDLLGILNTNSAVSDEASAAEHAAEAAEIPEASLQAAADQFRTSLRALWDLDVQEVMLAVDRIEVVDETLEPAANLQVGDVSVIIREVSNRSEHFITGNYSLALEAGGAVSGDFSFPATFDQGDLTARMENLALAALNPWTEAMGGLELISGALSAQAKVRYIQSAEEAISLDLSGLSIRDGQLVLTDTNIEPAGRVALADLTADIGRLVYPNGESVPVEFSARSTSGGRIKAAGSLIPDSSAPSLSMELYVERLNLPPFSTYAENFIGYGIDAGSLSLDTRFNAEGTAFTSATNIGMEKFALSTTPSGKVSLGVPIHLGIALLTDRDERLDLKNIEVFGDFADPKTKVSSLVVQALVKVFGKVVTAPFAFLGSLLPDGAGEDDLSKVAFAAGSSELDSSARESLRILAEALHQRPSLNLDIVPGAAAEADTKAWRLAQLQSAFTEFQAGMTEQKLKTFTRQAGLSGQSGEPVTWAALMADRLGIEALVSILPLQEGDLRTPEPAAPAAAVSTATVAETSVVEFSTAASPTITVRRQGGRGFVVRRPVGAALTLPSVATAPSEPVSAPASADASIDSVQEVASAAVPQAIPVETIRELLLPTVRLPGDLLSALASARAKAIQDELTATHGLDPSRIKISDSMNTDLPEPYVEFQLIGAAID